MSHLSKIFTSTPVDIPNRSGFDLSHENIGTLKVGTLTPILCEELLPNDTVSLGCLAQVTLPPMATDFYGRVDLRIEAFFVPNRILWAGWERFITMPISDPFDSTLTEGRSSLLPYYLFSLDGADSDEDAAVSINSFFGNNTLADYLGYKIYLDTIDKTSNALVFPNLFPYLAYHKIYDDWYRDSRVQTPLFGRGSSIGATVATLPYVTFNETTYNSVVLTSEYEVWSNYTDDSYTSSPSETFNFVFGDGVPFWALRQRNWSKDYFTTAHLYPQSNDSASGIGVDVSDSSFTIPDLRAANVVQRWIERNNIAGLRYSDQIKATFGVYPSDATLDRALFLGATKFGVYNKSVYTTAGSQSSSASISQNPFAALVGSSGASSRGMGDSSLISSFTAKEHGYLMVLASLVPHQYYASGSRRHLFRRVASDFANPLLQGLGEQPIHTWELANTPFEFLDSDFSVTSSSVSGKVSSIPSILQDSTSSIFGYTQQYAEYKYHEDEVHGLLRENSSDSSGASLKYFVLQSVFDDPELSSDFLQIPTDYMDLVSAVNSSVSLYGGWYDVYFNFKKISTLSEYVIPTLGDLKNTHKENIPLNGVRL